MARAVGSIGWKNPFFTLVECQHSNGGFGASQGHDPHLLYTLSAVQILTLYDCLGEVDTESLVSFITGLQVSNEGVTSPGWRVRVGFPTSCSVAWSAGSRLVSLLCPIVGPAL